MPTCRRALPRVVVPAVMATALAGCAAAPAATGLAGADVKAAIARGTMRSPRGAAVALASLDGAPAPLMTRLKAVMEGEARAREIDVRDPALADYLVRGYLDAFPVENGTAVRAVWDIYGRDRIRARRVEEAVTLPAGGADPWASIGDDALASLAGRGADVMAAFLAGTPEAAAVPAAAAAN